jgi:hypothetical protein
MNTYLRVSILGFAAGVLALLTFVAAVYLTLAVSTLAFTFVKEMAKARATGLSLERQIWALLGQSLVSSGWNALADLWDLWGAFIGFGLVGLLAAWGQKIGQIVFPTRTWWISFLWVAVLVIIAGITWIYVQGEQIALWMAESPETYRWRELVLDSHIAALTVSPIFALAFTFPAWAAWRWWYIRLDGQWFVRNGAVPLQPDAAHSSTSDYCAYATRMAALKSGLSPAPDRSSGTIATRTREHDSTPLAAVVYNNALLPLLSLLTVGCFIGYLITGYYHARVALRLQHGVVFVDTTTQPYKESSLQIAPDVRRLRIVNVNGLGDVSLSLISALNPERVVLSAPGWEFEWRTDNYLYQDMPVQNLAPGDYILRFEQRAGWGYFEYMLSQGGGPSSQALAVATGFLLAIALILAGAVVMLAITRMEGSQ